MSDFNAVYDYLDSSTVLVLYVSVPIVPFLIGVALVSRQTDWRAGRWESFIRNCALLVSKFAPLIAILNLVWALLVVFYQVSFLYAKVSLSRDLSYYVQVDLPDYERVGAINLAVYTTSFSLLSFGDGGRRQRRLQTAGDIDDDTFSLVYHLQSYQNFLTSDLLIDACATERNIIGNLTCIDPSKYKSMIPAVFDTSSCDFYTSFSDALPAFGLAENNIYVEQNVEAVNPQSSVLLSYFELGACESVTQEALQKVLEASSVGDVQVTLVGSKYQAQEYDAYFANTTRMAVIAFIACFLFMMIAVRGFVVTFTAALCIGIAAVNSAAVLSTFQYDTFSSFNLIGLFLLIVVGGNSVILFGSAWRHAVPPGSGASVSDIVETYAAVARPMLFTLSTACIALFCLQASPLIIAQQLGAFTGLAVVVFYVTFHYVLLPMWVFTSWFPLPKWVHLRLNEQSDKWKWRFNKVKGFFLCGNYSWNCCDLVEEHDHIAIAEFIARSSREIGSHDDPVHHVVPADQVRYTDWRAGTGIDEDSEISSSNTDNDTMVSAAVATAAKPSVFSRVANMFGRRSEPEVNAQNGPSSPDSAMVADPVVEESVHELIDASNHRAASLPSRTNQRQISNITESTLNQAAEVETADLGCCSGKRPLKVYGCCVSVIGLLGCVLIFYFTAIRYSSDYRLPRMYPEDTNVNRVIEILRDYRSSLTILPTVQSLAIDVLSPSPTAIPTRSPSTVPTFLPTLRPTSLPTINTLAPSLAPTSDPRGGLSHVDYLMTGCWGLSYDRQFIDGELALKYSSRTFQPYVEDGLVGDMRELCNYVNDTRDALNIHPDWQADRDCIFQQYQEAATSSSIRSRPASERTVTNTLLYWAEQSAVSSDLLGVEFIPGVSGTRTPTDDFFRPIWLCANFSLRSYVSSLDSDESLVADLRSSWDEAFIKVGAENASAQSISSMVTTYEFTYPILAQELSPSIQFSGIGVVVGFTGLLLICTGCDCCMSFFGALGMIIIIALTVCLHIYFSSDVVDYLDVVALLVSVAYAVDIPVHFVFYYITARVNYNAKELDYTERTLSPALAATNRYVRIAFFVPMTMSIIAGLPILFSDFQVAKKAGQFIIIISLCSYIFTVLFLPYMLAFGCRTYICEKLCYEEVREEEQFFDLGPPPNTTETAVVDGDVQLTDVNDYSRNSYSSNSSFRPSMVPARIMYEEEPPPVLVPTDMRYSRPQPSMYRYPSVANTQGFDHPQSEYYPRPIRRGPQDMLMSEPMYQAAPPQGFMPSHMGILRAPSVYHPIGYGNEFVQPTDTMIRGPPIDEYGRPIRDIVRRDSGGYRMQPAGMERRSSYEYSRQPTMGFEDTIVPERQYRSHYNHF